MRGNFSKYAKEIHVKRQTVYDRTKADYITGSGKWARDGRICANIWEQGSESQADWRDKEGKEVSAISYWKAKSVIQKLEKRHLLHRRREILRVNTVVQINVKAQTEKNSFAKKVTL